MKIPNLIKVNDIYTIFKTTMKNDFYFLGERHNFWELVYTVNGAIGVAEEENIYKLKKGDIIFHKPMEFHRIWAEDGTSPTVIIITFSLEDNDSNTLYDGVYKLDEDVYHILEETLEYGDYCLNYENEIKKQLMANSLEKSFLIINDRYKPSASYKKTIGSQNYKKIINTINSNINRNLSMEDIADLCNMSVSNLKKTFKKYSNMGIMKYFNNLKLCRAKEILSTEDISIAQLSEILGYSDPSNFTKAFKKEFDCTPLTYKKYIEKITIEKRKIYESKQQ